MARRKRKWPIRLDPEHDADQHKLIETLVLVKAEAGRVGLFKTMHALNAAIDTVGWEVAEIIEARFRWERRRAE